jgi:hypothetical protein
MNLTDCYFNPYKLNYRYVVYFQLILIVVIVFFIACQPLSKPLVDDEKQFKIAGLVEPSEAKDTVSEYVDRNWAENPYLMCQVNHLDSSYNTDRIEYDVKKYISFTDMELYPIIGRDECLNVLVRQMDVFNADKYTRTYYVPKSICCNMNSERDKLVRALISLGAKVGQDMSLKNQYHY